MTQTHERWRAFLRKGLYVLALLTALAYLGVTFARPAWHLHQLGLLREHAQAFAQGQAHPALSDPNALAHASTRRALAPSSHFEPMPQPGPGDWAYEHVEPTQNVADFVSAGPNHVEPGRDVLYLRPVGDFDPERAPQLEALAALLGAYFQLRVEILPAPTGYSATRRTRGDGSEQILIGDLMDAIAQDRPEDAHAVLGITTSDVYPESSWSFVFGMASASRRVGVFSTARYHQHAGPGPAPEALVLRRTLATMLHELGHVFGMSHCQHFRCLLNGTNSLTESDEGVVHLGPVCLRKLYVAHPFDARVRYRELTRAYTHHGLHEEAAWARRRLEDL